MTSPLTSPACDPVDVTADTCVRFATHLELLAHQLREATLDASELERLAAALAAVQQSVTTVTAAAAGRPPPPLSATA